ncbi:hypothetical protein [Aquamicrobium ahrensii]|uniref:Uncharacterized protein n=1 Tax=Aquamicrobium ahrensii TaxID=469551 RepID=A0ABV2KGK4_9HYPH
MSSDALAGPSASAPGGGVRIVATFSGQMSCSPAFPDYAPHRREWLGGKPIRKFTVAPMQNAASLLALRFYGRVLLSVLATIGIACLIAMQIGWLTTATSAESVSNEEKQLATNGVELLSASGATMFTSALIPVDPSLSYELSGEIRSFAPNGDEISGAVTYLGVIDYNEKKERLTSKPGPNRYAAASNFYLASARGWATLSGVIGGEGNENHNQFHPGTRFVRVVALLNYKDETMKSEIRNVRFAPRLEMKTR